MAYTIWKYPFEILDHVAVIMPKDAQVLAVQVQQNVPCLWALVDPDAPKQFHHFHLYGTGHPIEQQPGRYVGTFQMHRAFPCAELESPQGTLVFHLFEQ